MSRSLNKVTLIGNLGKDPEVRTTLNGSKVASFSVATSHLRDSVRRIRQNELQLGQLLDSASGTAFIATDGAGVITLF